MCTRRKPYDTREYRDIKYTMYRLLTLNRDHAIKSSDAGIYREISNTSGVSGARYILVTTAVEIVKSGSLSVVLQ